MSSLLTVRASVMMLLLAELQSEALGCTEPEENLDPFTFLTLWPWLSPADSVSSSVKWGWKKKGSLHGIVRLSVLFSAWCVLRIGAKDIQRESQQSTEMSRTLLSSQQGPAPRFADFKAKDEPHLAQWCRPACQVAAWKWLSIISSYLPSWSNTNTSIFPSLPEMPSGKSWIIGPCPTSGKNSTTGKQRRISGHSIHYQLRQLHLGLTGSFQEACGAEASLEVPASTHQSTITADILIRYGPAILLISKKNFVGLNAQTFSVQELPKCRWQCP